MLFRELPKEDIMVFLFIYNAVILVLGVWGGWELLLLLTTILLVPVDIIYYFVLKTYKEDE